LRDRAGPLAAVVLIHVGIGYGLLHLSGTGAELAKQADLAIFDISLAEPPPPPAPPPPPPPPVEAVKKQQAKPKRDEGASAPPNIESQATPVVVPKPRIVVPAPSPVVAAVTPAVGPARRRAPPRWRVRAPGLAAAAPAPAAVDRAQVPGAAATGVPAAAEMDVAKRAPGS
jgi:protein TonB